MRSRLVFLIAMTVALAACTPEQDVASRAEFDALREELADLSERLEDAERSLQQRERRRVGMEQDIQRLLREANATEVTASASAATDSPEDPSEATSTPTQTSSAFTSFMESEQGTAVLVGAMRRYQSQRDEERRKRVVSALVEPFAKKAYLSQDQAERMSETLETASQSIRDAWAGMRDVAPEQRGAEVQKSIMRTQEIRKETDDAIAMLLNETQFEMYEEERSRLLGMPGGRPGGGGDQRQPGR